MKYIGPFLRINKLKKENMEHQLFHLSKEAIKHITLYSRCGIYTTYKDLNLASIPNFDITTFKGVSPLLCVYKKGSAQIVNNGKATFWDDSKLKKEINIKTNVFMTLSLLELTDYYKLFKGIDPKKYSYYELYSVMAKKQLEFYASYFRNVEGVFVDKQHIDEDNSQDLKFEDKGKKFKYSNQALIMAAFYKASSLMEKTDSQCYEGFSQDIFNMLLEFKEEIYELSYEELLYTCLGLNLYYKYSKYEPCYCLLLDLCELLLEKQNDHSLLSFYDELELHLLSSVVFSLFYKKSKILKYKEAADKISGKIMELYCSEEGVFIKEKDKKESTCSSLEVSLSILCLLDYFNSCEDKKLVEHVLGEAFRRHLVDSGIILSWPDIPSLDDKERYKEFSQKNQHLLDEMFFKLPSIPTPESCEIAPIFLKEITYNKKKQCFNPGKTSFDAGKNMEIFSLLLILLNPCLKDEES